tara:strand:+ start:29 stop:361 length:333 start_codon:yes stop_codon:yes gene_type:complete
MSRFENRRWLVIPTDKIDDVNFNQVLEPNKESLRKSLDNSETFIKYHVTIVEEDYETTYVTAETGEEKSYIVKAGTYGRPDVYSNEYKEYKHKDMLELLSTDKWTSEEQQ